MENVQQATSEAIKAVFNIEVEIEFTRPDTGFGDWATNVAMKLAGQLKQNPREIAAKLSEYLNNNKPQWLKEVSVAGPGFINITLSDQPLIDTLNEVIVKGDDYGKTDDYQNQNLVVEYLDPNLLKELHIGHAYSGTIGDAIAKLFANAGATVHRVTYQGDVGLHVAKAMWSTWNKTDGNSEKLKEISVQKRAEWLAESYVTGSLAYGSNEKIDTEIKKINEDVYKIQKQDDHESELAKIYWEVCSWSLDYFNQAYQQFDFSPFEKNYLESQVAPTGLKLVNEHIEDGIFAQSQGAIIFEGDKYGLHTRVFVNSLGLPTYEAKDLGNAMLKWDDYHYDKSVIITGDDQSDYFKVMLKALEQFAPEQVQRTTHIAHGLVKLTTGKMASRTGQVVRALELLSAVEESAKTLAKDKTVSVRDTALAAIKYAFLKARIGGDIIYDVNESLSLEGNSGPYLQYAHARARSILAKSTAELTIPDDLTAEERILTVKIGEFIEVVQAATQQLAPHLICTYLYELAQQFNRFYEKNRIINDDRERQRLSLVKAYATVLKNGLLLLRIPAPDHM